MKASHTVLALVVALLIGSARLMALQAPAPASSTQPRSPGTGDAEKPVPRETAARGELSAIPTNFDRRAMIMPAWESGPIGAVPASAAPDNVGAFRFMCAPGQLSYDDPIVFANQPGKSHLHQFFGNTSANARSSYASLRQSGDSTCMNPLNRSAYWIPAMLNGRGQVVRPDYAVIYYKRNPASSPDCKLTAKECVPMPRGLRYVFGYDMVTHKAATGSGYFNCDGNGAQPGHYPTIVEAAKHCPIGSRLGALIASPSGWVGVRLGSPNPRAHMAYPSSRDWGYLRCPKSHPKLLPTFSLGAWYTVDGTLDRTGTASWHLSSDEMPGMTMPPGTTFHADWFGAWDDATLATWTANCIDKLLNCHGGDLGNGTQLRQVPKFEGLAKPRLVPVPSRG